MAGSSRGCMVEEKRGGYASFIIFSLFFLVCFVFFILFLFVCEWWKFYLFCAGEGWREGGEEEE